MKCIRSSQGRVSILSAVVLSWSLPYPTTFLYINHSALFGSRYQQLQLLGDILNWRDTFSIALTVFLNTRGRRPGLDWLHNAFRPQNIRPQILLVISRFSHMTFSLIVLCSSEFRQILTTSFLTTTSSKIFLFPADFITQAQPNVGKQNLSWLRPMSSIRLYWKLMWFFSAHWDKMNAFCVFNLNQRKLKGKCIHSLDGLQFHIFQRVQISIA